MEKSLKNLPLKYLPLLFVFFSQLTFAQCIATNEQCAPVDEWEFSLAIGAGVLTNPMHGGSNIPLVLIPKISYYGEKIFFENNALGYSVYETNEFSLSAVSLINRENGFFNRWHPSNVFVPVNTGVLNESSPGFDEAMKQDPAIDVSEVANRKWALDAGIQANWFISANNHLKIKVLHDVNNAYNGFNGRLEFSHRFTGFGMANTQWKITTGVNWLSKQQVDHYYGIGEKDTNKPKYYYQGKSAVNPFIKIHSNYRLNNDWRLTFTARIEFLAPAISNSPLVKDKTIETIFLGVVYDY
ncbi:MAG: MipA/OmpV family protein [Colwellia sp.]|nr:MipA/OmpV family protein [Colwellia sp.]